MCGARHAPLGGREMQRNNSIFSRLRRLFVYSIFAGLICGLTSACSTYIRQVAGNKPAAPVQQTSNPIPMKITPGGKIASGSQVMADFDITPTQQTVSGTKVSLVFSFYQNRPE